MMNKVRRRLLQQTNGLSCLMCRSRVLMESEVLRMSASSFTSSVAT